MGRAGQPLGMEERLFTERRVHGTACATQALCLEQLNQPALTLTRRRVSGCYSRPSVLRVYWCTQPTVHLKDNPSEFQRAKPESVTCPALRRVHVNEAHIQARVISKSLSFSCRDSGMHGFWCPWGALEPRRDDHVLTFIYERTKHKEVECLGADKHWY